MQKLVDVSAMNTLVSLLIAVAVLCCKCENLLFLNSTNSLVEEPHFDEIPFEISGPTTVQLPQERLELKIVFKSPHGNVFPLVLCSLFVYSLFFTGSSNITYYWEVLEGGETGLAETTYTQPVLTLVHVNFKQY